LEKFFKSSSIASAGSQLNLTQFQTPTKHFLRLRELL
jgi:hypothetical protein